MFTGIIEEVGVVMAVEPHGTNLNITLAARMTLELHATYERTGLTIGNDVSIGHNAIVHGCTIHDKVLIGMGAIVMDNAEIGEGCVIAAGAVVTQNMKIGPGSLVAGVPGKTLGPVSEDLSKNEIERIAKNYLMYAGWFKEV